MYTNTDYRKTPIVGQSSIKTLLQTHDDSNEGENSTDESDGCYRTCGPKELV
jgi:hypothetical protein